MAKNYLEITKNFLQHYPEGWVQKDVFAIGGGHWGIKVIGNYRDAKGVNQKEFLFEVVGANGTRNNEMASDLHQMVNDLISAASVC